MSTADSDLNITSITLVKDFLKPIFKISQQNRMLFFARIINVLIGSLAIIIARCFDRVADLVIFIAGFWGPVILTPLIFALFNIVISKKAFAISCLAGAIGFIGWETIFSTSARIKNQRRWKPGSLSGCQLDISRTWRHEAESRERVQGRGIQ